MDDVAMLAAVLRLVVALFGLLVACVALVVLFRLPGYMRRQEARLERLVRLQPAVQREDRAEAFGKSLSARHR